ncbi:MAG: hypothetical protein ACD_3C00073G0004 [uncultured bacterium (gcode 4)]|uniref:Uncharacterized protein n=1 Tax=uncultured bacterium (gcode 4) TaxID=1234023 RepID=K2G258_9BACT|nr:MAG: hypothetical protein ACD_3C00073G0004 [uncultured bacterium (gcode 4)]
MNTKVDIPDSWDQDKSKEILKQSKPEGTLATVKYFKSKTELLTEESEKWLEDYCNKILQNFWHWNWNLDDELRQSFANAAWAFWQYLAHINTHQPYNHTLFSSDINSLTVPDLFHRTIISFLLDMWDILNKKLMKKYLEKLITYPWEDEFILTDLHDFFEEVVEATIQLILHWNIHVDVSFYDKLQQ